MASTSLRRTLSSNGNQNTATWSFWVKRGNITDGRIYTSWYDGNNQFWIMFQSGKLGVKLYQNSYVLQVETNRLFRDTSAFYHILVAIDTTQGTASDRVKIYVNGSQETSLSSSSYPNQNASMPFGLATYNQRIGERDGQDYFDGLMSHFHFIDGTAYAPSDFGETDSTSGIWKPKTAPSVTYGTNGFFLKFENSGAMGTDSSGNSNTFTVSGTLTQNVDTPSNNFPTLNALTYHFANHFTANTNGNTTANAGSGSAWKTILSTLGVDTGKWYFEAKVQTLGTYAMIGICDMSVANQNSSSAWYLGNTASSAQWGYNAGSGEVYNNDSSVSGYGATYTTNDIIGVAMDLDNLKLYFHKNGTYQNSGVPTSGSTGTGAISITANTTYAFALSGYAGTVWNANFGSGFFGTTAVASANADANGHGAMEYAVPSGYYTLNTKNIKEFG
jgi:hypothetical protein